MLDDSRSYLLIDCFFNFCPRDLTFEVNITNVPAVRIDLDVICDAAQCRL